MSIIEALKEAWGWSGLEPEEVVGENDFGNLIVRDTKGRYWRVCPEDVYCEVVANSRNELDELSQNQEFLADWYMESLVSEAKEKFGSLPAGRKFHFVIPGVLGGEYGISNIRTVPQVEQILFSGDVGRQIQELPDGEQIKLRVIE